MLKGACILGYIGYGRIKGNGSLAQKKNRDALDRCFVFIGFFGVFKSAFSEIYEPGFRYFYDGGKRNESGKAAIFGCF